MKLPINTKIIVNSEAKFHKERIGYIQFYGEGPSEGVVVLADSPTSTTKYQQTLFAVEASHVMSI